MTAPHEAGHQSGLSTRFGGGGGMKDTAAFREAMARFPSGVVIVTTLGASGLPEGFTASAFCSVSLHPPLVLVCLADKARCHPAFEAARHFAVNLARADQERIATRFGTRGADKFAGDDFAPGARGLPLLRGAMANLICAKDSMRPAGDHSILIGKVEAVELGEEGPALVHHLRGYRRLVES